MCPLLLLSSNIKNCYTNLFKFDANSLPKPREDQGWVDVIYH